MLATCAVMGWPLDGYMDLGHPCQKAVSGALQDMLGADLAAAHRGIDGCGLTTYGIPLAAIAAGFATAAPIQPSDARRTRWPPTRFSSLERDGSTRRSSTSQAT